jgi:acyl-CoA thioester hydrolase
MTERNLPPTRPLLTYRGSVSTSQCDHMGHMNVQWYTEKFDQATWQLLAAIGLTATRLRADHTGMAGVEAHLEYKRELFPGDVVTVTSTMLEVRDKALRFVHEMKKDDTGELAARTVLVAVHLDAGTRKARALPADVRAAARAMIDGQTTIDGKERT